jgi:hypothetical protein
MDLRDNTFNLGVNFTVRTSQGNYCSTVPKFSETEPLSGDSFPAEFGRPQWMDLASFANTYFGEAHFAQSDFIGSM